MLPPPMKVMIGWLEMCACMAWSLSTDAVVFIVNVKVIKRRVIITNLSFIVDYLKPRH
jgi:hypothetical protein